MNAAWMFGIYIMTICYIWYGFRYMGTSLYTINNRLDRLEKDNQIAWDNVNHTLKTLSIELVKKNEE